MYLDFSWDVSSKLFIYDFVHDIIKLKHFINYHTNKLRTKIIE